MNPILQFFLCGLAFAFGVMIVISLVAWVRPTKAAPLPDELKSYWETGNAIQASQTLILERIAASIERKES